MTTTQTAVTKTKKTKATTAWTAKKAKTAKKTAKKKTTDFTQYEWEFLCFVLDAVVAATKGKTTVTQVKFKNNVKPVMITIGAV